MGRSFRACMDHSFRVPSVITISFVISWCGWTARTGESPRNARLTSKSGLQKLTNVIVLGTVPTGILCGDHWSAYDFLDPRRRQDCRAHLKRDFKKWAESQGPGLRVGQARLEIVRELFACWHRHRDGPGTGTVRKRNWLPRCYFISVYACPAPNAFSPSFETNFAHMEYVGGDKFALSFMRHTGHRVDFTMS
jgi:hypothetical protein